jgi:hypothetical protein
MIVVAARRSVSHPVELPTTLGRQENRQADKLKC